MGKKRFSVQIACQSFLWPVTPDNYAQPVDHRISLETLSLGRRARYLRLRLQCDLIISATHERLNVSEEAELCSN